MNKDQESGRKISRTHHMGTHATVPVSCRGGQEQKQAAMVGKLQKTRSG